MRPYFRYLVNRTGRRGERFNALEEEEVGVEYGEDHEVEDANPEETLMEDGEDNALRDVNAGVKDGDDPAVEDANPGDKLMEDEDPAHSAAGSVIVRPQIQNKRSTALVGDDELPPPKRAMTNDEMRAEYMARRRR